jgi:single-stranded-DNA-specific exonuclease
MRYRWTLRCDGLDAAVRGQVAQLGLPALLADCLAVRGVVQVEQARLFLEPRLRDLTDPFDFPGMAPMVDRLFRALRAGEPVLLFGDYDVDGVSSTALLQEVLSALGWNVAWSIPDRMDDGYGLTAESLERALGVWSSGLVLAIDCGVNAGELIAQKRVCGVEVMVLDHHDPGKVGWPDTPCIHPWLLGVEDHPARGLCSVGCAFKLAHGLVKRGRELEYDGFGDFDLRSVLDLVALGTVADLVPLTGENRILVAAGLRAMPATRRAGLRALMALAGVGSRVGAQDIGFQLAPRLNAAGRLGSAGPAVELLLSSGESEANRLADYLDSQNRERQSLERSTSEEVLGRLRGRFDSRMDHVVVEGDASWHPGVVGIVAARVVQEFHCPALILGGDGEFLRGSGRSVEGYDLAQALARCGDLLERGGGHAMAGGLTIRPGRLEDLRMRLREDFSKCAERLGEEPLLELDASVPLSVLNVETLEWLGRLEPTGQGNPRPRFIVPGLRLFGEMRVMGKQGNHLRFEVTDGRSRALVVWWGGAGQPFAEGDFDLAVEPALNHFRGRTTVQLVLLDWRPAVKGG